MAFQAADCHVLQGVEPIKWRRADVRIVLIQTTAACSFATLGAAR
jgi:hypothetical protein